MLHHLSGTVSLARLDHQTHSHLSNHLWNLIYSSYWLCVCVCVRTCQSLFWLFCSLLCGGLCAPIWRKSTLLLLHLFVVPFAAGLRHSGCVLSVHTVHITATRTKKYSKTGTILFCCKMIQKCNICSGGTLLWSQCVNTNDALLSSAIDRVLRFVTPSVMIMTCHVACVHKPPCVLWHHIQ